MSARILLVDDSPTIRKLVELAFRPTGFVLEFAATGRVGVARALEFAPDVILLDFMLPDMRGVDVCARLSLEDATRKTPVVVMSAKEELQALFAQYAAVAAILPKPFTTEQLVGSVRAIVDRDAAPSRFTQAQKEAVAGVLYACLKKSLAFIPSWCAQMGASPAAPFFARKLLTGEVVGQLLEALTPTFRDALGPVEAPRPSAKSEERTIDGDALLAGDLRGWPVADVLSLVGASGRTGALRLSRERGADVLVYFRAGEIVFVTSTEHDPAGKPQLIALAEQGQLAAHHDLAHALHELGRKLLLDVLDGGAQRFAFRELAAAPGYVEAYGRHVSMARKTLLFPPPGPPALTEPASPASLSGLGLERARHESHAMRDAWPSATIVLDRVRGFSAKVRGISFDAVERRVLALVDGRWTLQGIATRANVELDEARRVAWTLGEIGLVLSVDPKSDARPVLIVEPDVEGFQRQLESMLAKRAEPVPLVSLESGVDVIEAARRARPSLVILNAEAATSDLRETARALREDASLEGVSLVAVLDLTAANRQAELAAAGFDAVLVKPVDYADLERLIRI